MSRLVYHPATSVAEVVALLAAYGDDAQLLAGGTSVMLVQRLGMLAAEHVVGLRGVEELRGSAVTGAGELRLGALSSLRSIETDDQVARVAPALAEAVGTVATVRVRNQATIGGNLAHADPAQDPPPMLMALGARVEAAGAGGTRSIPVEDLARGPFETALAVDEVLTAVVVPPSTPATRAGYLKFLPGTQDDYATVSVAVAAEVVDGRLQRLRVALGGVGPTPVRARSVESALAGQAVDAAALAEAAQLVRDDIDPRSDRLGSAAYKATVSAVCVRRLLQRVLVGGEAA